MLDDQLREILRSIADEIASDAEGQIDKK